MRWPDPGWTHLTATDESGIYTFTSVDGGTFNNDPVALVHTALAGVIGRNPPDSSSATRAIFMIDPLADKPQPIGNVGKSLFSVVKNIVPTFIAESRYRTADMELFAADDVYSRYQLVPFRPPSADGPAKVGEPALGAHRCSPRRAGAAAPSAPTISCWGGTTCRPICSASSC